MSYGVEPRRKAGRHNKYVPNLSRLQATCDVNYARLIKLLPEVDQISLCYEFNQNENQGYSMTIVECGPYTTTLDIHQRHDGLPDYLQPTMQVRLYHDVKMAEVLKSQHIKKIQPSYTYPNKNMHSRNEKEMVNLFLTEWLQHCQTQQPKRFIDQN